MICIFAMHVQIKVILIYWMHILYYTVLMIIFMDAVHSN